MEIHPQYGNTVDGSWVPGFQNEPVVVRDTPAVMGFDDEGQPAEQAPADLAYSTLLGTTLVPAGGEGQPVYGVIKNSLYAYLIANIPAYAGTIT